MYNLQKLLEIGFRTSFSAKENFNIDHSSIQIVVNAARRVFKQQHSLVLSQSSEV